MYSSNNLAIKLLRKRIIPYAGSSLLPHVGTFECMLHAACCMLRALFALLTVDLTIVRATCPSG